MNIRIHRLECMYGKVRRAFINVVEVDNLGPSVNTTVTWMISSL